MPGRHVTDHQMRLYITPGAGSPARRQERRRSAMRDYVFSRLDDMPVDAVTGKDVMVVLLPIWTTKTETAERVRRRISTMMKCAVAQGHRSNNPAGPFEDGARCRRSCRAPARLGTRPRRARRDPVSGRGSP